MWVCLGTKLLMSWLVGDVFLPNPSSTVLTHTEIRSFQRNKMNLTWRNPPAHHWYAAKSPGLSIQYRSSRAHQTALARLRSGHLRSMNFVQGGVPECRVQTWRRSREHREEPKLHRKAWAESDRWRCTRARKVGNVVSSFQTRTACNEHVSNMYVELAEIHFIYGLADGNGRADVRLYRERYPTRRQPNHQTFARVHQNLVERGSFRATIEGTGRRQIARTPIFEEGVLHSVDQTPGTSVRALAASTGRSPTTIHRVLQGTALHPFHVQRVQSLQPDDPPRRVTFAQWFLNQIAADMHFASSVLFCDEATFSREGVFNTHMWALNNPHSTRPRAMQQRFTVNVWAGIEVLPELLTDVPAPIRRRMWFQQDGAPSHYARHVREHLDRTFPNRWIGCGGPVAWPPRSPDLSPLDFLLWGAMKGLVHDTPVVSEMDLVARISIAAARIREMPGVFEDVRQSMSRRYRACIHANGRNFEHFL
ncbi:DUF4817 domain-containing protein [Trichonephila clavipes]|nr:DUF4817 domain-containing protein [Trichonephila clavipes]